MDDIAHLDDAALDALLDMLINLPEEGSAAKRAIEKLYLDRVKLEKNTRELQEMTIQLEELRARHASLYDFTPVAHLALDAWGCIWDINHEGAALLGKERESLVGENLIQFAEPENRSAILTFLRELVDTNGISTAFFSITAASGRISTVRARGRADPRIRLRYLALVDVTESPPLQ